MTKPATSTNKTADSTPKKRGGGCPFQSKRGYVDARRDYLNHFHKTTNDYDDEEENPRDLPTESLVASTNLDDPLYFWQLHSIMGPKPVVDIVTNFYNRVFEDTENPWFRDVFERVAPKYHHIRTQVAYWVDAFGGGKIYHGGNFRLTFHHLNNANKIMNAQGAKRWMFHMRSALLHGQKQHRIFQDDPRVFPCIVLFLEVKMQMYAKEHRWRFDASDFEPLKQVHAKESKETTQQKQAKDADSQEGLKKRESKNKTNNQQTDEESETEETESDSKSLWV
ncbi:Bacterial-like globin [Seminavis robusta]|uniref:Bacterial-like globin n=1 Tax=Seminavis robusta TaxID=568900 RepID=A0A9N8E1X4_9STRA|nr:Bacterial-like globin [Seminavis robusta]|eukprot:Sro535_g161990.1 Bacterial-like globin (280) ;mRNA; f:45605-46444